MLNMGGAQAQSAGWDGSAIGRASAGGAIVDGVFLDEAALDAKEVELAEVSAHLDAATHRQLTLIRIMDVTERWAKRGAKSCAHWLSWRIGLDPGAARERVRVARKLGELPAVDDSLRRGELSYSKARAITRVGTPANEARLLDIARHTTGAQLEKICRGVRQQQREDARLSGAPAVELERYVRLRHRGDGTVRLEAILLPDEAERVMEAVRAIRAAMSEGLDVKPDHADALVRIADAVLAGDVPVNEAAGSEAAVNEAAVNEAAVSEAAVSEAAVSEAAVNEAAVSEAAVNEAAVSDPAGAAKRTRSCGADRAQVIVHFTEDRIDGGHMAVLDDGGRVSAETFRRMACDCSLLGVLEDGEGEPLDVGRKSRRISPALRRAVMLRDRGCRFPGCTHDRYIDLHHRQHWMHGGETTKANLLALCTFHHRLVHEGGFTIELDDTGEPLFLAPKGEVIPFIPPSASAPDDPIAALEATHAELAIDEETGLTSWDGGQVDYPACVGVVCAADEAPDLHLSVGAWLAKHGGGIASA